MANDDDKQLPANALPFQQSSNSGIIKASERVEMQRASAEVFAAWQMARQFPRDEEQCFEKIMKLCKNVHFCADAMYKIPNRGEGLTIKAAKSFALAWKNLFYGSVEHGSYGAESQMESYCYDMESNISSRNRYSVSHIVKANNQLVEKKDPAEIDVLCKARGSKEVRNSILNVIPDYIEEMAKTQIRRTLHEAVSDVQGAFTSLVNNFVHIGVKEQSLLRYCNKTSKDKLDAADIVDLRLLRDGIKEEPDIANTIFPERDKGKALPEKKEKDSPKSTKSTASTSTSASKEQISEATEKKPEVSTEPPKNTKIQTNTSAEKQEAGAESKTESSSESTSEETQEPAPEEPPKKKEDLF